MRKNNKFYDDGRTVANMNIDGMPFYDDKNHDKKAVSSNENHQQKPELSKKEVRQIALSGMLAGLSIALVFVAAAAILIGILYILG